MVTVSLRPCSQEKLGQDAIVGTITICSSRQLAPSSCVVFALLAAWSFLKQRLSLFWVLFRIFVFFFLALERLQLEALSCVGTNSADACRQPRYRADSSGAAAALARVVVEWRPRSCFAGPCLPCCLLL